MGKVLHVGDPEIRYIKSLGQSLIRFFSGHFHVADPARCDIQPFCLARGCDQRTIGLGAVDTSEMVTVGPPQFTEGQRRYAGQSLTTEELARERLFDRVPWPRSRWTTHFTSSQTPNFTTTISSATPEVASLFVKCSLDKREGGSNGDV